jgi:hypothetical protein
MQRQVAVSIKSYYDFASTGLGEQVLPGAWQFLTVVPAPGDAMATACLVASGPQARRQTCRFGIWYWLSLARTGFCEK